jgi:hypothetical protein
MTTGGKLTDRKRMVPRRLHELGGRHHPMNRLVGTAAGMVK